MKWLKYSMIVIILLALLIPASLYLFLSTLDLNQYKPEIEALVEKKIGHKLVIEGPIEAVFSLSPQIKASNIKLLNPDWAQQDALLLTKLATISLELKPLLNKRLIINEVNVHDVDLHLEVNETNQRNWEIKAKPAEKTEKESKTIASKSDVSLTPEIKTLLFENVRIHYQKHNDPKAITLNIPSITFDNTKNKPQIDAQLISGDLKGNLTIKAARFEDMIAGNIDFSLNANGSASTQLNVTGKLEGMEPEPKLSAQLSAKGESLSPYETLIGKELSNIGAYEINTTVTGTPKDLTFSQLNATFYHTPITGKARLMLKGKTPRITGNLNIQEILLTDKTKNTNASSASQATTSETPVKPVSKRVIPNIHIPISNLSGITADIDVSVSTLKTKTLTIENLMGNIVLRSGILQFEPLTLNTLGGIVSINGALDSTSSTPSINLSIKTSGITMEALTKQFGYKNLFQRGPSRLKANLKGQGHSLHTLINNLNGSLDLFIGNSKITHAYIGRARNTLNIIRAKKEDQTSSSTTLDCVVSNFSVTNGILRSNHLIADATEVRVQAVGTIDLPQELLALTFYTQSKKSGLNEINLPVKLRGHFINPNIEADKSEAALSLSEAFIHSKKLAPLQKLLKKDSHAAILKEDVSHLHKCLEPINLPSAEGETQPTLRNVLGNEKEGTKEGIKKIEDKVRGVRDIFKGLLKKD